LTHNKKGSNIAKIMENVINLSSLKAGDLVRVIDTLDEETSEPTDYTDLLIVEPGRKPVCIASSTGPNGTYGGEREDTIEGSERPGAKDKPILTEGVVTAGEKVVLKARTRGGTWVLRTAIGFELYPGTEVVPVESPQQS
jgi:hypothetical protein